MSIFTTHFRTFSRNKYWVLLVQAIQSDFELFLEIIQNITVKIVLGHKVFLQLKLGLTVIGHNGSTVLTYFCLVGLGSERTFQFVRNPIIWSHLQTRLPFTEEWSYLAPQYFRWFPWNKHQILPKWKVLLLPYNLEFEYTSNDCVYGLFVPLLVRLPTNWKFNTSRMTIAHHLQYSTCMGYCLGTGTICLIQSVTSLNVFARGDHFWAERKLMLQ